MSKKRKRSPAQSTLEYAVLIVLVAIALIATQTYIKRAMQGRLKASADDIGDQFSPGSSRVVSGYNTHTETNETVLEGVTTSALVGAEITKREVNIEIGNFANEYWPGPINAD